MSVVYTMRWERNAEESLVAFLHVDQRLSEGRIFDNQKDVPEQDLPGTGLLRLILAIDGVQDVMIDRYVIRIERPRVIRWDSICQNVELAVERYLNNRKAS